jgi:hypothetical protein
MKRNSLLLATLLGLLLAGGLAAVAIKNQLDQGPVYSVAAIQAHLARTPSLWLGRNVRVQGRATACAISLEQGHFRCTPEQPRLRAADGAAAEPLLLVWEAPAPLWLALWRLPLLRALLPTRQLVYWGVVASYRVQLRALPADSCPFAPCYEALLLDAAPGALGEG